MSVTFTEFYCDPVNGSNLNAGSTNGAPFKTYASGNWDGTSIFTVASGNPSTDGVTTSMYASVYVNGSTTTGFVSRITSVTSTQIAVSTTIKAGTAPTVQTGTATIVIGGYWKGPNATDGFPLTLAGGVLTDTSFNLPRVNLKNSATYSITANIAMATAGPVRYQGMTSTPGDGGYAIIDGGTTGASYALLTLSGSKALFQNIKFAHNGSTGTSAGITNSSAGNVFYQCVISNMVGAGIIQSSTNATSVLVESEIFSCNTNNAASTSGYLSSATSVSVLKRCFIHDNTGTNASGLLFTGAGSSISIDSCIIANNGASGMGVATATGTVMISNCDFYNNGASTTGDAIARTANTAQVYIENCNFLKNSGWGINFGSLASASVGRTGWIINCGFGVGTQANTSGNINGQSSAEDSGTFSYATGTTPWNAPATGDFTLIGAAANQARFSGRGAFVETGNSMSGTVSYPDVGAAPAPAGTRSF